MHAHACNNKVVNRELDGFRELFDFIGILSRRRYQIGEKNFGTLGLNHTEARLLTLLAQKGGTATQEDLSNLLYVDRSNAGRGLKALEQKKYLTRSKDRLDARTKLVKLTAKGLSVAVEIDELRTEISRSFFGAMTKAQANTVLQILKSSFESHPETEVAGGINPDEDGNN